jgi:hypothetical protein
MCRITKLNDLSAKFSLIIGALSTSLSTKSSLQEVKAICRLMSLKPMKMSLVWSFKHNLTQMLFLALMKLPKSAIIFGGIT